MRKWRGNDENFPEIREDREMKTGFLTEENDLEGIRRKSTGAENSEYYTGNTMNVPADKQRNGLTLNSPFCHES